ncbi:hypothetical protein IQ06DRAFT_250247 [Phaeosphaeriaceae sp. SRC1lsM3a]|nr:hypothetical protein IQ06DRAFT_250247 [Stagonospora sp. SRC1lsM3a]
MAQQHDNVLQNIRDHVKESQQLQDDAMEFDASNIEARLRDTVKELQARVREQQEALEKLKSESQISLQQAALASNDPRQKLQQLLAVKEAYNNLKPTPTYLPSPRSVFPALLAARSLQQSVHGTKEAITSTQSQLTQAKSSLRRESAQLHDAQLLTAAMESRIQRLRTQHEDRSQKTPAQLARDLIAAKRAQKDACDAEIDRLGTAMNDFINDYLSAMIAAEELGGPVVGEMLDVEDDVLAAGFTKQGRAKSVKKPVSEKSRQRRIDQIWGARTADEEEEPPTEAEAADEEMRKLIENLFATLIGPGGGKAYFQLERDSAASRFLVRAKVAQFHPKDARRLRLIDFGRELED